MTQPKKPKSSPSTSTKTMLELHATDYNHLSHPPELENLSEQEQLEYFRVISAIPAARITVIQLGLAYDLAVISCKIFEIQKAMKGQPLFFETPTGGLREHPLVSMLAKLSGAKNSIIMKMNLQPKERNQFVNAATLDSVGKATPAEVTQPMKSEVDFKALAAKIKNREAYDH